MIPIEKTTKVGRFWDMPKSRDDLDELVKEIVEVNKIARAKYESRIWLEYEYNQFCRKIKIMSVFDFHIIYPILLELITLPEREMYIEAKKFVANGIYIHDEKCISCVPEIIASSIIDVKSKITKFANLKLVDDDKKNENIFDNIEKEERLLKELLDDNSDYNNLLRDAYREWVNKYFSDSRLKELLLEKINYIIDQKKRNVRSALNKHKYSVDRQKEVNTLYGVFKYHEKRIKENKQKYLIKHIN